MMEWRDEGGKQMSLTKATERIYYMEGEQAVDRPFLYYIWGDEFSVVIDAGNSKQHVEKFYQAIDDEQLPRPSYTLITHWHWDHTFGLPYVAGKTIANERTRQKLVEVSSWSWTRSEMARREQMGEDIPFCNECIQKEYPDLSEIKVKTVDLGITEPMTLDLGGVSLTLYPMDSIHSRDALLIYCPEEKALFVGDADCEDHYEGNGTADPVRTEAYQKFIQGLEFVHYFLGHDVPDTKDGAMKYLEELHNQSAI